MPISQMEGHFENLLYRFSKEPILFLLALKWNLVSMKKGFPMLRQKPTEILP